MEADAIADAVREALADVAIREIRIQTRSVGPYRQGRAGSGARPPWCPENGDGRTGHAGLHLC